jgi:hypothetical protein
MLERAETQEAIGLNCSHLHPTRPPFAVATDVTVVGAVVSWFVFAYTDAYRCLEPKYER